MQLVRDLGDPSKFISFADSAGIEEIHRWKGTPEFREQIGRIKQHTDASPIEAELTVRVAKAAPVLGPRLHVLVQHLTGQTPPAVRLPAPDHQEASTDRLRIRAFGPAYPARAPEDGREVARPERRLRNDLHRGHVEMRSGVEERAPSLDHGRAGPDEDRIVRVAVDPRRGVGRFPESFGKCLSAARMSERSALDSPGVMPGLGGPSRPGRSGRATRRSGRRRRSSTPRSPLIRTARPVPPGPVFVPVSVQWYSGVSPWTRSSSISTRRSGKRDHEALRSVRDGRPPDRRAPVVDRERAVARVVRGDACRVAAAPGLGVAAREILQRVRVGGRRPRLPDHLDVEGDLVRLEADPLSARALGDLVAHLLEPLLGRGGVLLAVEERDAPTSGPRPASAP